MDSTARGTIEMTAAMVILGTIGWFVVMSGEPIMDVVFWRCAFGAITLLIICAALGLLRGRLSLRIVAISALGGAAIVVNWLLLFSSFSRASISIATAVYNTQPF
ncbi:MAG: EamA/RhaT family transporter, partial [Mesorhizobium sp.]